MKTNATLVDQGADWLLPDGNHAEHNFDYFSDIGYRKMAVDMLIGSVKITKSSPSSYDAQYERDWLKGIAKGGKITSEMCFQSVADGPFDFQQSCANFIGAMDKNPDQLISSLLLARKKISHGEFEIGVDQVDDAVNLAAHATRPRMLS